ncbi:SMI1/KNR4 family protein [Micromonospora mirobrigensis]|uniref:Knr4/Smi1-like domain-containing protein n=1 Tax=Micromonospora mirobrigensis TaxID=262898 RepID=A0A1C4TYV1_9ACTN|nr:SMI1/KNR4 family protein [Micromonospora mirobrigensis]SCE64610.1 hypothetical protein GA0070564_10179 [Micromonospora mirobrigensis]
MLSIEEVARRIREVDENAVEGLSLAEVRQVSDSWGVDRLPDAYVEFLVQMGVRGGRLLQGTEAFFPEILELPRDAEEFFQEDEGGMPLPRGAQVFAMHQGYQVYWLSDLLVPDPEVVLYMERRSEPMEVWPSFTHFINAEFQLSYPTGE